MRRAIVCVAICTTLGCGTTSPSASRDGGSGGDAPSVIPANPCAGIEPPAQGPMLEYVVQQGDRCLPGTTDGLGTLAFPVSINLVDSHGSGILFVTPVGKLLQTYPSEEWETNPLHQPVGFVAVTTEGGYVAPKDFIGIPRWNSLGDSLRGGSRLGDHVAAAANPAGGVLVAGNLRIARTDSTEHVATMFTGGGEPFDVKWGPKPLASGGAVFGAGVDSLGRSLVITDGTQKYGNGYVSGQWFEQDGTPLTGEFVLLKDFSAGTATQLETSPLIGGGLLVRRMDLDRTFHALVLVVVPSGSTTASAAPEWMISRRDVKLEITRGGRAYVALPYGAHQVTCSQRVEVFAQDGTSCGSRDFPIAVGTCDTRDVTQGADGTIIQQLPLSMETRSNPSDGAHTCTWRWWAGALR